ncbi:nucleotidyltransferase family protein [Parabacteroides bouchesdurhonensis]|uniref:nucleotidyltransferase family protein n=1 Tax=Parabacteroides bouchesdurhonensis TaxID=1936995 RepID=UPI000C861D0E|nr:nucleotidyltransferase domain-containing protein [Parabacteroides bouchesdurhonensis]
MKSTKEYLAILRDFMKRQADTYGILSMGIFGSVARGEQHEGSDLDVFVELREADPFIMGYISDELESLCGCKIDLLRLRNGLNKLLLKRIEQDGIPA